MSEELIVVCPKCPKEKEHEPKLYINAEKGVFNCFRCGFKGSIKHLNKYPALLSLIEDKLSLAQVTTIKNYTFIESKNKHDLFKDLNPVREVTPDDPEYLYLMSRGWTEDMFYTYLPLVSVNPKFKSRVILPIFSESGELIYFTSRLITNDPNVSNKYLNAATPKEGILFKSQKEESVLYSKDAFICEGIFDAAKIPNAVALLGKILSPETEKVLFNYLTTKKNIFICLDSGAEYFSTKIAEKLLSWFPNKSINYIDTNKYEGKDLGKLSETLTSVQLVSFIKNASIPYNRPTLSSALKSKLNSSLMVIRN